MLVGKLCRQPAGFQLRPLSPLSVHFKIRLLTFAFALLGFLADARLSFSSSDVGAGCLRGEGWSWSGLRFKS